MGSVKRRRRDWHHVAVAPLVRAAEGLEDGLGYRQVSRAGVALGRLVDEMTIREADALVVDVQNTGAEVNV